MVRKSELMINEVITFWLLGDPKGPEPALGSFEKTPGLSPLLS
jgi:hypothetical protein